MGLTTDPEGRFSIEVPSGRWTGIPDEIELLKRGYFCLPGFVWEPEIVVDDTGIVPGEIILFESPVDMELIAVPITPEIKMTDRDMEKGTVKLTAEFQFGEFEPPFFNVVYQIWRSEDMKNWEQVTLMGIDSFVRTKFGDTAPGNGRCYYRARRQGPVSV
ncbi:MAG: hypothetical protein ACI8T1_004589 [Verrucomicrobiales bacterium]|jgi:hypothetical protein